VRKQTLATDKIVQADATMKGAKSEYLGKIREQYWGNTE